MANNYQAPRTPPIQTRNGVDYVKVNGEWTDIQKCVRINNEWCLKSDHPVFETPKPEFKVGQTFNIKKMLVPLRIMAIVENYVVCRFKGCVPSVHTIKDFANYIKDQEETISTK